MRPPLRHRAKDTRARSCLVVCERSGVAMTRAPQSKRAAAEQRRQNVIDRAAAKAANAARKAAALYSVYVDRHRGGGRIFYSVNVQGSDGGEQYGPFSTSREAYNEAHRLAAELGVGVDE